MQTITPRELCALTRREMAANESVLNAVSLNCESCGNTVSFSHNFCSFCGTSLNGEEMALKYYFWQGYEYDVIVLFLSKFHGIEMSVRTLKNRFSSLGLRRKDAEFNEGEVRQRIQQEIDGPGCLSGYRSMWHTLRREGYAIPRHLVQRLLKEMDPDGCEMRRKHRLQRRAYVNPGPNYCWHIDGYDKLKPYGFPIHACIDGFSRKVLWLKVVRSNNNPVVVAKSYLEVVRENGGCPTKVRSDCGTENGLLAATQCFFMNDLESHIYGTSPHNQRIEAWWSFYRRSRATWWINFFKDLMERSVFTPGNDLEMECLWFCFSNLIQHDLDTVKDHWNTHFIRRSRHETVSGRPDQLFFLPELHSAQDYKHSVTEEQCQHILENHLSVEECRNEYEEYFEYVTDETDLTPPKDWREGLDLYSHIIDLANHGS